MIVVILLATLGFPWMEKVVIFLATLGNIEKVVILLTTIGLVQNFHLLNQKILKYYVVNMKIVTKRVSNT